MEQTVIYEVIDSLTNNFFEDTESHEKAEQYYSKGYLIVEHRIIEISVSSIEKVTLTHSKQWTE